MRYVKIPMERVPVLVGKNGLIKKQFSQFDVQLEINSQTGEVKINSPNSLFELDAENVVRMIGRGFSPDHAFCLFNEDYYFEIYDIRDWVGKKTEKVKRMAGRVIGKAGKSRRVIEELTNTYLSVYGHTIAVIGKIRELQSATHAIEMLLTGSTHPSVYRYLEKERKKRKLEEFGL